MPPFTVRWVQVVPESSVVRIVAPTAIQRVVLEQATAMRAGVPEGRFGALQLVPASEDTKTSPL